MRQELFSFGGQEVNRETELHPEEDLALKFRCLMTFFPPAPSPKFSRTSLNSSTSWRPGHQTQVSEVDFPSTLSQAPS